jgi:WD40 repeat protein
VGGRALLASGSSDCTVRMWDLEWGGGVSRSGGGLHDSNHDVRDHQSSAGGESSESCGKVMWGSQRGEPLRGHYRGIHGVAFSPDGSLLAGFSLRDEVGALACAAYRQRDASYQ